MLEVFNFEQGSDEWKNARTGVITASCFSQILPGGKGKTRRTYLLKIASERITGNQADTFSNAHMERGHEQESAARDLYVEQNNVEVTQCGLMKNFGLGYSPDGLVADDGLIEIKSKFAHLQAEILLDDEIPSEHIAQLQGGLLISERKYIDFISFCPGMPLFIKRVFRDEDYISKLKVEIFNFEEEVQKAVNTIVSKF